jgi:hypothetical protein
MGALSFAIAGTDGATAAYDAAALSASLAYKIQSPNSFQNLDETPGLGAASAQTVKLAKASVLLSL